VKLIDQLMGDGIMAVFAPGFAGPDHPGKALEAAQDLLHAFGYQTTSRWISSVAHLPERTLAV
jgi:hypothetical protein